MGSRGPTAKLMGRRDIDPRFNRGNKLRPKYESPLDQQENMNQEPIKTAPKSTRLRPPMQNLAFDPRVIRGTLSHKYKVICSHLVCEEIAIVKSCNTGQRFDINCTI
jgi:hypothetical protein